MLSAAARTDLGSCGLENGTFGKLPLENSTFRTLPIEKIPLSSK